MKIGLEEITNSIGMKLVLIPAGTFIMGSPTNEVGRFPDETRHEVTLSKSYYLGVTEVTQEQYEKVMGKNPSANRRAKHPIESLSWDEAVSFCKKLSELPEEKATGLAYRLPTEAEWEYACRATSTTSYCFGDTDELYGDYAWSDDNTHPVGQKKANRWGLYDMHGNVWEWCQDWYAPYPGTAIDPQGPSGGSGRVSRGGGLSRVPVWCRSARRSGEGISSGFRIAMSPAQEQKSNPIGTTPEIEEDPFKKLWTFGWRSMLLPVEAAFIDDLALSEGQRKQIQGILERYQTDAPRREKIETLIYDATETDADIGKKASRELAKLGISASSKSSYKSEDVAKTARTEMDSVWTEAQIATLDALRPSALEKRRTQQLPRDSILDLSADGEWVATRREGGELLDRVVKILKVSSDGEPTTLEGAQSVVFSSDGKTAAGIGSQGWGIWDTDTGHLLRILKGSKSVEDLARPSTPVAFSTDGKLLALRGKGGTVRLWSTATGEELMSLSADAGSVGRMAFAVNGKTLAISSQNPNEISVWDIASRIKLCSVPQTNMRFALSPDSATLATAETVKSAGPRLGSSTTFHLSVRLWDAATGQLKGNLDTPLEMRRGRGGSFKSFYPTFLAFSPNGQLLAVTGSSGIDGSGKILNLQTGRLWKTFPFTDQSYLQYAGAELAFSADGKRLIVRGKNTFDVWDLPAQP